MKPIKKEIDKFNIIITMEESRPYCIFWKKIIIRQFIATEERPQGYWNWMELPDYKIVGDHLSFQLNRWNQHFPF